MAERAVQTYKAGIKKITEGDIHTPVCKFLFNYRIMPSVTGLSPEMLNERRFRCLLDQLYPDLQRKAIQALEIRKHGWSTNHSVKGIGFTPRTYEVIVLNTGDSNWITKVRGPCEYG